MSNFERKLRMVQIKCKAQKCRVSSAEKRRTKARRAIEDIKIMKEIEHMFSWELPEKQRG